MIDYKGLIEKYGSPLYVYDLSEVSNAYQKLVNSLPDCSIIYYSLKANPNPEVTKHLVNLGCHAEVSSTGELDIALNAGTNPKNCIYTGPGKTKDEIKYALSKGVNHFSVESVEELQKIDEIANNLSKMVDVTLRINPAFTVSKVSIKMTGVPSQFGFDEESIDNNIINLITKSKSLKINGIHIYNGSNFHNSEMIEENFVNILTTITNIQEKLSLELEFIDFGGGFSAPFGKNESLPNYEDLKERLTELIKEKFKEIKIPKIAFESGRYLTASCGTLIGTVQSVKMSKGKKYCIVDFGINHLGGMSGLRRIPTVELQVLNLNASKNDSLTMNNTNIVGPLCTPLDYLAKNVNLQEEIQSNDIVFIKNVGAYGLTGSLLGFLSREIPNEVIIKNQEVLCAHTIKLIRESAFKA